VLKYDTFKEFIYYITFKTLSENQKGVKTFEQMLKLFKIIFEYEENTLQKVPVNIALTLSSLNDVLYAYSTSFLQGLQTTQEQTSCGLYH